MKYFLLLVSIFTFSFANYSYQGNNMGKIDMHGGKGDKLMTNKPSLSNGGFNSLGTLGISKPKKPTAPKALIVEPKPKQEKKEKETTKEDKTSKTTTEKTQSK